MNAGPRVAISAASAGLTESRAGHILSDTTRDPGSYYVAFECSCGMRISGKLRSTDKKAAAEMQRSWERHLELADADPHTVFEVGTINIKKGGKRLFVAPRHWVGADAFNEGQFASWAAGTYIGTKGWGVFQESTWRKEVVSIHDTKESAFTEALRIMDIAQKRGSKVIRECDSVNLPASDTARTVIAALLGINESSAGLAEIEQAITALEAILPFMPLLEQKHLQLVAQREHLLLSPIRAAS